MARAVFLLEAHNILDHVAEVAEKQSDVERLRLTLDLVRYNARLFDEMVHRFVERVRPRVRDASDADLALRQRLVDDIVGDDRIRICEARVSEPMTSAVIGCVRRMDALVDGLLR